MKHLALLVLSLFCWCGLAPAKANAVTVVVSTGGYHHRHWVHGHWWHHRWIPAHWARW